MNTELYRTIDDPRVGEALKHASEIPGIGLMADDIASAVGGW